MFDSQSRILAADRLHTGRFPSSPPRRHPLRTWLGSLEGHNDDPKILSILWIDPIHMDTLTPRDIAILSHPPAKSSSPPHYKTNSSVSFTSLFSIISLLQTHSRPERPVGCLTRDQWLEKQLWFTFGLSEEIRRVGWGCLR
ncbi:hypothetical protein KSP40_PGU020992 [Platanthera guangdongensis]|uniref:Uncharacterized protein n=1 Tax=Platanthera guangdongensis TaxID=2320717 RepID=A0ABR2MUD6_9ASPA